MSAKLCTNVGQLKIGQRVVNTHLSITWRKDALDLTTVQAPKLLEHYVAGRYIYMFVPGPCKHCREGAGLVRRPDGEWVSCNACFGGYL